MRPAEGAANQVSVAVIVVVVAGVVRVAVVVFGHVLQMSVSEVYELCNYTLY